ncbi:YihY/virulence factor BrkB family protein [Acetobacteraceae bacterium KSS8]|uniref:YihY/virulence factor BrkB family protein n=1 Tax=Endosaccharibacter trunci TaxID=2812733 RepID=A0ABT1W976_9PROT|nr:YihY/virulence factor BrkB family protein [Acetobacteraceae bacterium KSS8]
MIASAKTPGKQPGAEADGPGEIPPSGWLQVGKRLLSAFLDDRIMAEAASCTFYSLLALFPAIATVISIYGLFADPAQLTDQLDNLKGVIPGGGMDIIRGQVQALISSPHQALGLGVVIGLLTSLWSANNGTKSFFDALNVVYHEKEKRSFIRLTLQTLCFTFGAVAFLIVAMLTVVVVPIVLGYLGFDSATKQIMSLVRWPAMLILMTIALGIVYRFGPSRNQARYQWISWGAAFAAIGWVLISAAFSYYVANFGSYNKTYGSLGAVIGFMTWIWISTIVVLMGAELNAELELQTGRDTTVGPDMPAGKRGAFIADHQVDTRPAG